LTGTGEAWERISVEELSAKERNLWRALSPEPTLHLSDPLRPLSGPGYGRLLVVGSASVSQFDALCGAVNEETPLPARSAVIALDGEGFRGQQNRRWATCRGNIHLCVYEQPNCPAGQLGFGLTMLPTVAVVDTVRRLAGPHVSVGIKWVNDVLLEGRKIAGAITTTVLKGGTVEHAVTGVGFNVEVSPPVEPTVFVPRAGCLADRVPGSLKWFDALPVLLGRMSNWYVSLTAEGPKRLLERYRQDSLVIGRRVEVHADTPGEAEGRPGPPLAEGKVASIGEDLRLRLEGASTSVKQGRLVLLDEDT
jgi:biotin-(acetyl-CoA carboxylase) ligase